MSDKSRKPAIGGGAPTRTEFLDFARPYLDDESISLVTDVLKSGWLTTGPRTEELENLFAPLQGRCFALGLNSCTAGLFLALKRCGVGPGDEVITTPLTFAASANVILHTGATPVFADVSRDDWFNIDPDAAEAAITPKTRGMILVHYAGRPLDIDRFNEIASKHGLFTIGDCAHAVEAEYRGKPVGSAFDFTSFSFYANKNATCGEGGMICTDDPDAATWLRIMRLHGMDKDAHNRFTSPHTGTYDICTAGYKFNMPDIAAAILKPQLEKLDEHLARRTEIWNRYNDAFSNIPGVYLPPSGKDDCRHSMHVYSLMVNPVEAGFTRDDLASGMLAENIGIGVHYTPVHLFTAYREALGTKEGMFPVAEEFGGNTLSLPLTPYLTDKDVEDVINAFRGLAVFLAEARAGLGTK